MTLSRVIVLRLELVDAGKVNGYNKTEEYAKRLAAVTAQINRMEAEEKAVKQAAKEAAKAKEKPAEVKETDGKARKERKAARN
jgi:hypothetical protein